MAVGLTLLFHLFLVVVLAVIVIGKQDPEAFYFSATMAEDLPRADSGRKPQVKRPRTGGADHFKGAASGREPIPLSSKVVTNPGSRVLDESPDFSLAFEAGPVGFSVPVFSATGLEHHGFTRSVVTKAATGEGTRVSEPGQVPVSAWTGIQITKENNSAFPRIGYLVYGGPAHRQGVLSSRNFGDYLVSVDGKPTSHLPLHQVRDMIVGKAGSIVRLHLCKFPGGPVLEVSVERGQ